MSHAKAIRANDQHNYAEAIEMEKKAIEGYERALAKGMNQAGYLMAYTVLLLRTGNFSRAMELVRITKSSPT